MTQLTSLAPYTTTHTLPRAIAHAITHVITRELPMLLLNEW